MLRIAARTLLLDLETEQPYNEGPGTELPLGRVLMLVLDTPMKEPSATELSQRLMLRAQIAKALRTSGEISLQAEQIVLLKGLIATGVNPPGLAATACAVLEGKKEIEGLPIVREVEVVKSKGK